MDLKLMDQNVFNHAVNHSHLDWLEAESIYILREVVAECRYPALMFSGGKDSVVMLHLALKAFGLGPNRQVRLPFPVVHIDTGHNYPEVIQFRDQRMSEIGAQLIIGSVEDSIQKGTVRLRHALSSRNAAQAVTLLEIINEYGFTAMIGGARRDEEKARAKERIFSFRDEFGQWNPKAQRPELWDIFNTKLYLGEHLRVFPISNWTELDIWQYIEREELALPEIYFAHQREVMRRQNVLVPVNEFTPKQDGEQSEVMSVRFRTVGDMSCTCPIESNARTIDEIIAETVATTITERGATRMDDQLSEVAMEERKKQGYF